jgi:hypothetical protein
LASRSSQSSNSRLIKKFWRTLSFRTQTEPLPELGILQYLDHSCGRPIRRLYEKAIPFVLDLVPDASDVAADDGSTLPHGLGDRETEAFAGRLLQDHSGRPLQRVHEGWIIDSKNDDAFIVGGKSEVASSWRTSDKI